MKNLRPLLFMSLNAMSVCSFCQTAALKFQHIGMDAGLSQSNVTCILQDSRGFMWFGTRDGLDKYDGYQFTVYENAEEDPQSISNNFVTSVIEDNKGDLWIGTWGGGLNRFDREKNRFVHHLGEQPNDFVNNLLLDSEGNIWVDTDGGGLFKHVPGRESFIQYLHDDRNPHSLSDNDVTTIFEDSRRRLWVGTSHSGLNLLDRQAQPPIPASGQNAPPPPPSRMTYERRLPPSFAATPGSQCPRRPRTPSPGYGAPNAAL